MKKSNITGAIMVFILFIFFIFDAKLSLRPVWSGLGVPGSSV